MLWLQGEYHLLLTLLMLVLMVWLWLRRVLVALLLLTVPVAVGTALAGGWVRVVVVAGVVVVRCCSCNVPVQLFFCGRRRICAGVAGVEMMTVLHGWSGLVWVLVQPAVRVV